MNYTIVVEGIQKANVTFGPNGSYNYTWKYVVENVEIMSSMGWMIFAGVFVVLGALILFLKD